MQDCLSLLANLLRLNVSNQSFFRETGGVAKLVKLLGEVVKEQQAQDGLAEWAKPQHDKNVWGFVALLRLFLVRGGFGTQANQLAFWQSGVLQQVLLLAFSPALDITIRAEVWSYMRVASVAHNLLIWCKLLGSHHLCRHCSRQCRYSRRFRAAGSPIVADRSYHKASEWQYATKWHSHSQCYTWLT